VFTQVTAGTDYTCGLRNDGAVSCWGDNRYGQSEPPRGPFTEVSAGIERTCGLRPDGSVVCWGDRALVISVCAEAQSCGDAIINGAEQCDDGDTLYSFGDYCGSNCSCVPCGQPTAPEAPETDGPTASDALFTLKAAVGSTTCDVRVCDVNSSATVTVTDALAILRTAVGQPLELNCPN